MKEDKSTGKRLTSCICVCMCVYNTENIALYYTCISQIRASPSQHTNISDVWGYKAICITDVQPHNKIKHSLKRDQQKFTHQANLQSVSTHLFYFTLIQGQLLSEWEILQRLLLSTWRGFTVIVLKVNRTLHLTIDIHRLIWMKHSCFSALALWDNFGWSWSLQEFGENVFWWEGNIPNSPGWGRV